MRRCPYPPNFRKVQKKEEYSIYRKFRYILIDLKSDALELISDVIFFFQEALKSIRLG